MPGLRNVGLLATQELRAGVPELPAWEAAVRRAGPLLGLRGRPLVEQLGFGVQVLSTNTSLRTVDGRNRAIAVFCDEDEPFDAPARRFDGTSPVSRGQTRRTCWECFAPCRWTGRPDGPSSYT